MRAGRALTAILLAGCAPTLLWPQEGGAGFSVFGVKGLPGAVLFRHQTHEGAVNPNPADPHRNETGVACTGCHHKVTAYTAADQFRACSKCHGPEGSDKNPEDKEGIDLSAREISHRSCIGCHRAAGTASPQLFPKGTYTRCSECHDAKSSLTAARIEVSEPRVIAPPDTRPMALVPADSDAQPAGDRWQPPFPANSRRFDPYSPHRWKGDSPIGGTDRFLTLSGESDSLVGQRQLTGSVDSGNRGTNLFSNGEQVAARQNLLLTFDLSSRGTAFHPADWRVSVSPAFNSNFLHTQRNGIVNADPSRGNERQKVDVALQSAFTELRLGDTPNVIPFLHQAAGTRGNSPWFDSTAVRTGIQPFVSDFRGFLFNDVNMGVRLFGNASANRYQFNAAGFGMLEKNVNSELNSFRLRRQTVLIFNVYRQDTWVQGYTALFSFHYNHDRGSPHTDENGFVDRRSQADLDALYLGWSGEGHFGRLNLTHAFYQALGRDGYNLLARRAVIINAQMAAVEASVTRDWMRFKAGFLLASGDRKPSDGTARGFDSIMDAPEFAGGRFSFWNSQAVRLLRTDNNLVSQNSLLPSLRSNKFAGEANFVNPGLLLYNAGMEADLTPKVRLIANWNYLQFHHTEPLAALTGITQAGSSIGLDSGFGLRWRPLLNENILLDTGYSFLMAGAGLRDLYGGDGRAAGVLHSAFVRLRLAY